MAAAFQRVVDEVNDACLIDRYISNRRPRSRSETIRRRCSISESAALDAFYRSLTRIASANKKQLALAPAHAISIRKNERSKHWRLLNFGRRLNLEPYIKMNMLHLVPKVVNVVTVSALPIRSRFSCNKMGFYCHVFCCSSQNCFLSKEKGLHYRST